MLEQRLSEQVELSADEAYRLGIAVLDQLRLGSFAVVRVDEVLAGPRMVEHRRHHLSEP